jgi:hypothetical protein
MRAYTFSVAMRGCYPSHGENRVRNRLRCSRVAVGMLEQLSNLGPCTKPRESGFRFTFPNASGPYTCSRVTSRVQESIGYTKEFGFEFRGCFCKIFLC